MLLAGSVAASVRIRFSRLSTALLDCLLLLVFFMVGREGAWMDESK